MGLARGLPICTFPVRLIAHFGADCLIHVESQQASFSIECDKGRERLKKIQSIHTRKHL